MKEWEIDRTSVSVSLIFFCIFPLLTRYYVFLLVIWLRPSTTIHNRAGNCARGIIIHYYSIPFCTVTFSLIKFNGCCPYILLVYLYLQNLHDLLMYIIRYNKKYNLLSNSTFIQVFIININPVIWISDNFW